MAIKVELTGKCKGCRWLRTITRDFMYVDDNINVATDWFCEHDEFCSDIWDRAYKKGRADERKS